MASDLTVQTIRGPGSGANANQILIPSGQKIVATEGGLVAPGQIIQIVQTTFTSSVYLANPSSATSVGHTISITPKSVTSKVLIQYHFNWGQLKSPTATQDNMKYWTIFRNGSNIAPANGRFFAHQNEDASSIDFNEQTQQSTISYLDSPSTVSQVTYDLKTWSDNPTQVSISYNQRGYQDNPGVCTAIAMEVAQ